MIRGRDFFMVGVIVCLGIFLFRANNHGQELQKEIYDHKTKIAELFLQIAHLHLERANTPLELPEGELAHLDLMRKPGDLKTIILHNKNLAQQALDSIKAEEKRKGVY